VLNFKQESKRGRAFPEPDIAQLKQILKSNNSFEQLALETFGIKKK
jgi:hypothetical protein